MTAVATELHEVMRADALARHLGFQLVEVEPGAVQTTATPDSEHLNAGGIVHGGFLSALADWSTGAAAHSAVPDGHYVPHSSLAMQYLKVARPGIELRCAARCLSATRKAASAEAEIRQGDVVIARALSTHVVVERRDR
jgi:acyl-CoA thioesterase